MPHFTIYEGEAAVRHQKARLEAENRKLRAENERLRAKCGEAAVAEVEAQLAATAPSGQSFSTGDCQVTIGAPQKAVQLNPLIARARAGKAAQAPVAPIDLPASTQPQLAQEEVDEVLPSQRFSLLELNR